MGFNSAGGGGAPTDASYLTSAAEDNLSNETVVSNPENVPAWTEDGNSPVDTSEADGSHTYTLNSTWDLVRVHFNLNKTSANNRLINLRVNGDTGTNYDYHRLSGTTDTGNSSFRGGVGQVQANGSSRGTFTLTGRWSDACAFNGGVRGEAFSTSVALHGYNSNVSSPLTQFTIVEVNGESFDLKLSVYGRDI